MISSGVFPPPGAGSAPPPPHHLPPHHPLFPGLPPPHSHFFPGFHPGHPLSSLHSHLTGAGKRKKSWTRAVFSNLQRKGLEKRFQLQKYITKPDRRQLAASLGLTDAQVMIELVPDSQLS